MTICLVKQQIFKGINSIKPSDNPIVATTMIVPRILETPFKLRMFH
jgi:hypothetical protein